MFSIIIVSLFLTVLGVFILNYVNVNFNEIIEKHEEETVDYICPYCEVDMIETHLVDITKCPYHKITKCPKCDFTSYIKGDK